MSILPRRTRLALPPLAALALASGLASARAEDGPPNLDIQATCSSSGRESVKVSDSATVDGCLRSERAAQDELKRRWKDFSPAARKQCLQQFEAGGYPSYVEAVTCLELATGVIPGQPGGQGKPKGVAGGKEDDTLSAEPPANQRTNPIDVLNDKKK